MMLRLRGNEKRRREQMMLESTRSPSKQTESKKSVKPVKGLSPPAKKQKRDVKVDKVILTESEEQNQNIFDYLNLCSGTSNVVKSETEASVVLNSSIDTNPEPTPNESESVEIEPNVEENLGVEVDKESVTSESVSKPKKNVKPLSVTMCYICPNCPENFSNKTLLRIHSQTKHYGQINLNNIIPEKKSYIKCSKCSLKFFNQYQLNIHKNSCHTFIKQLDELNINLNEINGFENHYFTCLTCSEKFDEESELKNHEESFHTMSKSKYFCSICNKPFERKEEFRYHNQICRSSVIVEKCDIDNVFTVTGEQKIPSKEPKLDIRPTVRMLNSNIKFSPGYVTTKEFFSKNPVFENIVSSIQEPNLSDSSSDEGGEVKDNFIWESTKIDPNLCTVSSSEQQNESSNLTKSPVKKVIVEQNVSNRESSSTINRDFFDEPDPVDAIMQYSRASNSGINILKKVPTSSTVTKSSSVIEFKKTNPVLIYKPNPKIMIYDPNIRKSEELKIAWQQVYDNNVKCLRCNLYFNNHSQLNVHLDLAHGDELSQLNLLFQEPKVSLAFKCGQCPARFSSSLLLRRHWKECKPPPLPQMLQTAPKQPTFKPRTPEHKSNPLERRKGKHINRAEYS